MTGLLSSFVRVSFRTSLLKTDEVSAHALRTAAIATCFSAKYASDMAREMKVEDMFLPGQLAGKTLVRR